MKIAIVTIGNLYRLPYLDKYLALVPCGASVDIICWNREGKRERHDGVNVLAFDYSIGASSAEKAIGYLRYRKFVLSELTKNSYDRIVVTPTQMGLLIADYLSKKLSGRYVLDIRDYCHEGVALVRLTESLLVKKAHQTVISSEGYKAFLPSGQEYLLVHNDRNLDASNVAKIRSRNRHKDRLTIACIGYIAYHEQHKRMIRLFGNDDRFRLLFAGAGSDSLKSYCEEIGVDNVIVLGAFTPSEILDLYSMSDIVNGIYGVNCPELDYALSNKLYFAAELNMPIVCNSRTYMEKVSADFGFGIGINMSSPEAKDVLFDYYNNLDWNSLEEGCALFLKKVAVDNQQFEEAVSNFFSESAITE